MIPLKTSAQIEIIAQAGQMLAKIIRELKNRVEPGLTTKQLDKLAQELIFSYRLKPAFKGYRGFPAVLCTCLNQEIVHSVPSERELQEGDVLSLDLGVVYQGLYADMAITLPVGSVDPEVRRLIRTVKKALRRAIVRCKPGKTIGDVSFAIQKHIEAAGFQVVRELAGHGIGRQLHEEPEIPNYGQRHKGPELKPGMVLAIEPMAALGRPGIKKSPDGHGYQTIDQSWSVHFEHTVAVTEKGPRVLTE